jgi:hypothetical protein
MKKILFIAIAIGTLGSCKKKDDAPQLEVTAANIAGTYRMTAHIDLEDGVTYDRFNGGNIAGVPYSSNYETCEKDDILTFTAAGNVTSAEGATSCTPPTPSFTFPFTVNTAAKTITITAFGQTEVGTVKSLTAQSLVIENTETSGGVSTVSTITYTK